MGIYFFLRGLLPHVMGRLARQRTPGLMWMRTPARSLLTMVSRRCSTTLSFSVYPVHLGLLRSSSGTAHSVLVRIYVYMEGYIDIDMYLQPSSVLNHTQRMPSTKCSRIKIKPIMSVGEGSPWGGFYEVSRDRLSCTVVSMQCTSVLA